VKFGKLPRPPKRLLSLTHTIEPADGLDAWARKVFLDPGSPLWNVIHDHLKGATIGWLWTNKPLVIGGIQKAGRAQMPKLNQGDAWLKMRHDQQLISWFGGVPDFLITLYALWAFDAEDVVFLAVNDHELGHCGQKMKFGFPIFSKKTNKPQFAMRGHDFEQFNFIVERYGPRAAGIEEAVKAARKPSLIDLAIVTGLCGTRV
jgi:Putative phage metallopeptidase